MPEPLVCPNCGSPLEDDSIFCDMCGAPISSRIAASKDEAAPPPPPAQRIEAVTHPAGIVPPESSQLLCPACKKPVKPDERFCIYCGTDTKKAGETSGAMQKGEQAMQEGEQAPTGGTQKCASCGFVLKPGASFCIKCGAKFGETGGAPATPALEEALFQRKKQPPSVEKVESLKIDSQPPGRETAIPGLSRLSLMNPRDFLDMAKKTPLAKRPQSWWDLLSILGGALSGYLWFFYGSIRGLQLNTRIFSYLNKIAPPQLADAINLFASSLPPLILLTILVIVIFARGMLMKLIQPIIARIQKLSLQTKLICGIIFALIFYVLTKYHFFIFSAREDLDYITPLLMAGLPILFIVLRKEIDMLLLPFQSIRKLIPRPILIVLGLAIPFLTAFILYYGLRISEYPLMRSNVLIGTILSYLVLRTPQKWTLAAPGSSQVAKAGSWLILLLFMTAVAAYAHDFLRDPFNLNDGLRTSGIAPLIAGVSTVVVTMLVNGVQVAQTILQSGDTSEHPEREQFQVVVDTVDMDGARSTTLSDSEDGDIFIYAHCEKAGARFPSGDPTIRFGVASAREWVTLKDLGTQNGRRCARVSFVSPLPDDEMPETVLISVTAGADGLIGYNVSLDTEESDDYLLEIF